MTLEKESLISSIAAAKKAIIAAQREIELVEAVLLHDLLARAASRDIPPEVFSENYPARLKAS